GDEDVAWIWFDRHLDTGHGADLSRPGARTVEDRGGEDVARGGANPLDAVAASIDAGHGNPLEECRAQRPGGVRVAGGDRMRARDAVAGTERSAEDVVAGDDGSQLAKLRGLDKASV